MKITFWSDYACPYCYIGEVRLKKAIASLGMENEVELEPKAFELDPGASKTVVSDTLTRFARKYGLPAAQAKAQIEHISQLGRELGIDFRYATTRYTNTFDAHRLMKMALATGDREIAEKVNMGLFDAYFTKNQELADENVLVEVGEAAGLAGDEIRAMLHSGKYADEVRADEREAMERGIRGVPYFVFEDGTVIPGAASEADLRSILSRGKVEAKVHQCGPDGCVL